MVLLLVFAWPVHAAPLAVVAPDGACTLHILPAEGLAALESELAEAAGQLEAMATRLLADAAAMRLASAREAVPAFGDWAYDWVQSYLTAYRVLGHGVRGLAQGVAEADAATLADRIAQTMATPVREAFRVRVLEPAIPASLLLEDRLHAAEVVQAEWRATLAATGRRLAALPRSAIAAPGARRIDLAAGAAPFAEQVAAGQETDPLALIVEEGADTNTVFLRSMRPMAARLGAVILRVSEAGSLVATGGAFGYALGGSPGVALGVVGGVGLSWGLDWVLNRLDSALSRSAFEAQALEAIARAEARLAAQGGAAVGAALAAQRGALLSAQRGALFSNQPGCG